MKLILRILAVFVGLLGVLFIAQGVASEQGEVVVVTTFDGSGDAHTTRLWVVDAEGRAWLRSGAPGSAWYLRVSENPLVRVDRGAVKTVASATPVVEKRDEINRLMREKYGWADQFIGALFGRDDAIPLRLDGPAEH
jgi:hypothetical protein